ncbi:MAG: UvrB/UvrC motif-containing protein [Candidatus Omnitrophota bacterium]
MLCDICKTSEATVHLTEIVNENITKMHLCEKCAREKGEEMETHFGLSDLLAGLSDFGMPPTVKGRKSAKCPSCGFTFMDFQRIGRLGCHACYDTFRTQLVPLLKRIHGSDSHMGKMPVRTADGKMSKDARDLHEVKKRLQKAIDTEAYEDAAVLRDKIRELEKKLQKRGKDENR